MNEETTEAMRSLGARLFALQAGLMAVIKTHPHPRQLEQALTEAEDAGLANMLYHWNDTHLDQYRRTLKALADQIPRQ